VLAHEVSHIRHNDLSVMAISDWVSRATSILSNIGQFALLITFPMWLFGGNVPVIPWLILIAAPWISILLQLGLSRTREFDADREAVELTGDPEGLASALLKLERAKTSLLRGILLPGWGNPEPSWLRTHPATSERIERLMEIKPSRPAIPWSDASFHPMNIQIIRNPRWRWPGLWY
jgi:heat shock protein HtpX